MSLDMYLDKHIWVKNYGHLAPENHWEVVVFIGGWATKGSEIVNSKRIKTIVEEVGHWSGARAIHRGRVVDAQPLQEIRRKPHYRVRSVPAL